VSSIFMSNFGEQEFTGVHRASLGWVLSSLLKRRRYGNNGEQTCSEEAVD